MVRRQRDVHGLQAARAGRGIEPATGIAGPAGGALPGRAGWCAGCHGSQRTWSRADDDRLLFEMLTLEGAQAGLSWSTILRKRANYQKAFARFDPKKVTRFDAARKAALLLDPGIVRNRLKIDSTVTNARSFLQV
ncbi:MAG: DNA-3-methyladenine glycosylase I [Steroidobacteraceae bacterium]